MKSAFLIAIAGALTAAPGLHAEELILRDHSIPQFLEEFDLNGDRHIDEEEQQAIRDYRQKLREESLSTIDSNSDGEITREEIRAARNAIRTRVEERRKEYFNEIAGEDSLIDSQEFLTIPGIGRLPEFVQDALFVRLDADESGSISYQEFLVRLRSHQPKAGNNGKPNPSSVSRKLAQTDPEAAREWIRSLPTSDREEVKPRASEQE